MSEAAGLGGTPQSNLAVGSLVLTSSVNSGVTISRPVVMSRSAPTAMSVTPRPGATNPAHPQNLAAALQACLSGHLLEQANSILQRRTSNIVPSTQSQAPTVRNVPDTTHTFRVRVINPDCKKQYDTYMLQNVSKECVNSPQEIKKRDVKAVWK